MSKSPSSSKKPIIYQMFPRNYVPTQGSEHKDALAAMTEDMSRVAGMGYNTVYINPLSAVGAYPKHDEGKVGSMYATHTLDAVNPAFYTGNDARLCEKSNDSELVGTGALTGAGLELQAMCKAATDAKLTPMFDLVMAHLSYDSPYIAAAAEAGIQLIARHNNGNFEIQHLDEKYNVQTDGETGQKYTPDLVWDDVTDINWEKPGVKPRPVEDWVLDNLFIPYAKQMARCGFEGIRIDAPYKVPPDAMQAVVNAFTKEVRIVKNEPNWESPVFPELLGQDPKFVSAVKPFSKYIISSVNYYPNLTGDCQGVGQNFVSFDNHLNHDDFWAISEIADRQNKVGTVIAPASSHDSDRLIENVTKRLIDAGIDQQQDLDPSIRAMNHTIRALHDGQDGEKKELADALPALINRRNQLVSEGVNINEDFDRILQRAIRIKLATAAFISDGWMLTSGDEFLTKTPYAVLEGKLLKDGEQAKGMERTGEFYEHSVWSDKENTLTQRRVDVTHQDFMPDLIAQHQTKIAASLDGADLVTFIKGLNTSLAQSEALGAAAHFKGAFSGKDNDVVYYLKVDKDDPSRIMEAHAVNVSPEARNVTITPAEMQEELSRLLGVTFNENTPPIDLVGTFAAKSQQHGIPTAHVSDATGQPLKQQGRDRHPS